MSTCGCFGPCGDADFVVFAHGSYIIAVRLSSELTRGLDNGAFIDSALQVNANITADSGGTCVCEYTEADPVCKQNVDYLLCKGVVQRDLVTATAAIAALTSVRHPDVRSLYQN